MTIYNSGSFDVIYNLTEECIQLTCSCKLQSNEFKEGLIKALECAGKYQIKHWLFDVRAIGSLNEEAEVWLQGSFFPQIMSTLGTNNFVALLLSKKCYDILLSESGKLGLKSYNSFIKINTFCELDLAEGWLHHDAGHLQR